MNMNDINVCGYGQAVNRIKMHTENSLRPIGGYIYNYLLTAARQISRFCHDVIFVSLTVALITVFCGIKTFVLTVLQFRSSA